MAAQRQGSTIPVLVVLSVVVVFWYAMAVHMNGPWQRTLNERAGVTEIDVTGFARQTWAQDKPMLPVPHQIVSEAFGAAGSAIGACLSTEGADIGTRIGCVWQSLGDQFTSRRSLFYHAWITLSATLAGFALGTVLGIGLAVVIVYNDASNRSLMPWIIASQTIPILAVAPMVVVGLGAVGITGLVPKSLISMYLSFFPVVVGMVKGLRSPEAILLDLLRTYDATPWQVFAKLRWPASMPFLFAAMKVGIAISLIGAVVGELSNAAGGGLGVRLLTGSYNGQTIQIWAALLLAATLAAVLVVAVGAAERLVNARMGVRA